MTFFAYLSKNNISRKLQQENDVNWVELLDKHGKAPGLMSFDDLELICKQMDSEADVRAVIKHLMTRGQSEHLAFKK